MITVWLLVVNSSFFPPQRMAEFSTERECTITKNEKELQYEDDKARFTENITGRVSFRCIEIRKSK